MARPAKDEQTKTEQEAPKKARKITDEEAIIFSRMGMSSALNNEQARRLLVIYLEDVLSRPAVGDDEAKTALSILAHTTVSGQRELCNKVIARYVDKFSALLKEPVAA